MKRKAIILGLLCAVLFLAGIFGSLWILTRPHGTQVEIVQDGVVLQQLDLTQAENQVIEVEYEGRINQIQIEDGKIRISAADCPDNTCVHMGWLDSAAPIVCLPNHLVIQFAEISADIDAFMQ